MFSPRAKASTSGKVRGLPSIDVEEWANRAVVSLCKAASQGTSTTAAEIQAFHSLAWATQRSVSALS